MYVRMCVIFLQNKKLHAHAFLFIIYAHLKINYVKINIVKSLKSFIESILFRIIRNFMLILFFYTKIFFFKIKYLQLNKNIHHTYHI